MFLVCSDEHRVCKLDDFCPILQAPELTQARHQEAALQHLVELFKNKEQAEEAMTVALQV